MLSVVSDAPTMDLVKEATCLYSSITLNLFGSDLLGSLMDAISVSSIKETVERVVKETDLPLRSGSQEIAKIGVRRLAWPFAKRSVVHSSSRTGEHSSFEADEHQGSNPNSKVRVFQVTQN